MSDLFKAELRRVKNRIEDKDPNAFDEAVKLTEQYPDEAEAWNTLAYANQWKKDYPAAVAAMTRAIELRPGRPGLYCTRGECSLMAGDYDGAIADFTEGLALGNHLKQEPYREVLHFLRAEAYYQLGRKAEALADLEHVDDDCTFWTVQVRTKAELLVLCGGSLPPSGDGDTPESSPTLDYGGNLLVEDQSALTEFADEDEAALAKDLGEDGLAVVDAALLRYVIARYHKAARVIWDALEFCGHSPKDKTRIRLYARQLIALADAGAIKAAGNLRRPRFSEVCLPDQDA